MAVKKEVRFDERAAHELQAFSKETQAKFAALLIILEKEGQLKEPFSKRLSKLLFEIRVKHEGQWRALYAYIQKDKVIVLSAFNKKTQKTPQKEIKKAEMRLRQYL